MNWLYWWLGNNWGHSGSLLRLILFYKLRKNLRKMALLNNWMRNLNLQAYLWNSQQPLLQVSIRCKQKKTGEHQKCSCFLKSLNWLNYFNNRSWLYQKDSLRKLWLMSYRLNLVKDHNSNLNSSRILNLLLKTKTKNYSYKIWIMVNRNYLN